MSVTILASNGHKKQDNRGKMIITPHGVGKCCVPGMASATHTSSGIQGRTGIPLDPRRVRKGCAACLPCATVYSEIYSEIIFQLNHI